MVTSPYYPLDVPSVPVHHVLLQRLQEYGDAVALIDGATGQRVRYSDLLRLTRLLASALYKLGLRKGDVVAAFSPNHVHYGVIIYASLCCGAIVTTANPSYTAYELTYHMKDSGAKFVFADSTRAPMVKTVQEEVTGIQNIFTIDNSSIPGVLSLDSLLAGEDGSAWQTVLATPFQPRDDVALLPYSSGTTGLPKGVCLTHANILANLLMAGHPDMQKAEPDTDPIVAMAVIPMYHVYGLFSFLFLAMLKGGSVVVISRFQPRQFLEAIDKYKITHLSIVPPLIIFLSKTDYVKDYDLSSLKYVGSGAAPLSPEAQQEFNDRLPQVERVRQGYGMTETTLVCIALGAQKPLKLGSVGQPMPMTEAKVIDPSGRSLGPHERGELCIRGPQIMRGYWNKPQATKDTIDEFGFLHTGDIAYYDEDGYFYIVDRIKELIKVKGLQVAPAELEAVLLTHPLVADVGVTGIPHATAGEIPRAYVVLKPGAQATASQMQDFVAERVSRHKQLAGGVLFVAEIPKNPSGKILRRKLKDMAANSKL